MWLVYSQLVIHFVRWCRNFFVTNYFNRQLFCVRLCLYFSLVWSWVSFVNPYVHHCCLTFIILLAYSYTIVLYISSSWRPYSNRDPLQWMWRDPYAGQLTTVVPFFQFTTGWGHHILTAKINKEPTVAKTWHTYHVPHITIAKFKECMLVIMSSSNWHIWTSRRGDDVGDIGTRDLVFHHQQYSHNSHQCQSSSRARIVQPNNTMDSLDGSSPIKPPPLCTKRRYCRRYGVKL